MTLRQRAVHAIVPSFALTGVACLLSMYSAAYYLHVVVPLLYVCVFGSSAVYDWFCDDDSPWEARLVYLIWVSVISSVIAGTFFLWFLRWGDTSTINGVVQPIDYSRIEYWGVSYGIILSPFTAAAALMTSRNGRAS